MNRNDIVRQYKWMKVLRVFLKIFSEIFTFLLVLMPFAIIIIMSLILWIEFPLTERLGIDNHFFILVLSVPIFFFFKKTEKFMDKYMDFIFNKLNMSSNNLFQHYEKKWGMTEQQIKDYIAKRKELGEHLDIYVFPYIRQFCNLNEDGRKEQEVLLSGYFSEDEITLVYSQIYLESLMLETDRYWRKRPLSEKKPLLELLFKLTIVQDGIHNDEWNLLMNIMMRWGFNKNYIEFYKNRYSPLRTEFDESEYRSNVSKQDRTVSYLKPYFEVLGLEETATDDEIKRAYHNLALQHHPDLPKNAGRVKECEILMTKINEAYEKVRN